ncbi:peptidoglycan DD-metalloendopeptidase family protein [Thermoanaerobacterium thermosaccharolyticum]|uniref:peptidoglycan DD-metalloendopeptidase family protein n=1 Tax=Thermoanaerobacterium thermosaccharolyticum TaxID=1517 RepID=UPI0017856BA3|nr:M23 family metallopeptidase [Thermoanaerobacterium thermosaccharolyticum]MBE0069582.1 M23 family metallopeptidase [Thermoanaerobacterium thermosaccharolyticum]MBE0229263.1 M23 family metallopeptidase [Thermoanaerobacterium thermosaccharolyticum]
MKPNKWQSGSYSKSGLSNLKKYFGMFENQLIVCFLLLGVAMLFKAINVPMTNKAMAEVKSVLNYNSNYENTKKGLKLVMSKIPSLKNDVVKVFSNKTEDVKDTVTQNANTKMIKPISGDIVSVFGTKVDPNSGKEIKNDGIDISVTNDEPVEAVLDGEVMIADNSNPDWGKVVVIRHNGDVRSVYAYLSEIDVKVGDKVLQGQVIGRIGSDKNKSTALHFEIWENGKPVDPESKINFNVVKSDVQNEN